MEVQQAQRVQRAIRAVLFDVRSLARRLLTRQMDGLLIDSERVRAARARS